MPPALPNTDTLLTLLRSDQGSDPQQAWEWLATAPDLRRASLRGANRQGTDLVDADLWGARLNGADLSGAAR